MLTYRFVGLLVVTQSQVSLGVTFYIYHVVTTPLVPLQSDSPGYPCL